MPYYIPPPAAAWVLPVDPSNLKIPTYFTPLMAPPLGVDPDWWPMNAAQQAALCSPAELLLFGGQSGGGKSDFLVGDAMQEYQIPSLRGLLLRETLGEFDQLGDRMEAAYRPLKARYQKRTGGGMWTFPSGARVRFGYLASDRDLSKYRGNPYSWLGIDESGLHPLHRVRQMMAWLSSTDRRLRVRGRFASNPGGMGHGWQMAVFLRNRCPLHYSAPKDDSRREQTSVVAGKVYKGASWVWPPSAAHLVRMTTAFFPASVDENPFYGQEKIDKLDSQTPEIRMQLRFGCWCNAEGLYFGFLNPEWLVPRPAIQVQWWWNHIISIDFGYGNSSASAGLFAVDEPGRMFGVNEMIERKMSSVEFAKKICEQWIKPRFGAEHNAQRRRVLYVTIDPANDSHHGDGQDGKSNYELMAEVFAEYGVPCIKSHKDPADNAQVLYNGLASRMLILTDGMRDTFNAIATRTIDDRRAVKKVHGDPDDDRYDMASYAYNTYMQTSVKPERLKIMEEVEARRKRGHDETAIAHYSLMAIRDMELKERERKKGMQLGGARIGRLKVPR
jgi:hypothetical protein